MNYQIPIKEQIFILLRGTPIGKVKKELKKSAHFGLDIDFTALEAHYLASGNISDLIDSMIFAAENGIHLDKEKAAIYQLVSEAQGGASLLDKLKEMKGLDLKDIASFFWGNASHKD